jgi:hypothetical protein
MTAPKDSRESSAMLKCKQCGHALPETWPSKCCGSCLEKARVKARLKKGCKPGTPRYDTAGRRSTERTCPICAVTFIAKVKYRLFCSVACAAKVRRDPSRPKSLNARELFAAEFAHQLRRDQAHRLVASAIKAGELVRQACVQCGMPNGEAHHEDYSRPLDVTWLCRQCHARVHVLKRRAA